MAIACRVIALVTYGLPSRSPPIHVPIRMKAGTDGGWTPTAEQDNAESARR
jgi:hypothetical protein